MSGSASAATEPELPTAPRLWRDESLAGTAPEVGREGARQAISGGPAEATALLSAPSVLLGTALALFDNAGDEYFEDGVESLFSRSLVRFITAHGSLGMDVLAKLILSGRRDPVTVAEALRWIGRIDDSASYGQRLWLLERCLLSAQPEIRDGACLGLASLDDPRAIVYVRKALEVESIPELRQALEHLSAQLVATKQCHWS